MQDLKERHSQLIELLRSKSGVQYVGSAIHGNIGDLLIFLGTLKFLRDNHFTIARVVTLNGNPSKWNHGPLLLQGGGDLGDLYPSIERFREQVIQSNYHRRIVIAPQTIYFKATENFNRAKDIMWNHPDLYLCVRDTHSYVVGRHLARNVYLVPDMAHELYPIHRVAPAQPRTILRLLRKDSEANCEAPTDLQPRVLTSDWDSVVTATQAKNARRLRRLVTALSLIGLCARSQRMATHWEATAHRWVAGAIEFFSRYEIIETNRLHGHILACLMNIPNTPYDNSYGKVSGYWSTWMKESPIVTPGFNIPKKTTS